MDSQPQRGCVLFFARDYRPVRFHYHCNVGSYIFCGRRIIMCTLLEGFGICCGVEPLFKPVFCQWLGKDDPTDEEITELLPEFVSDLEAVRDYGLMATGMNGFIYDEDIRDFARKNREVLEYEFPTSPVEAVEDFIRDFADSNLISLLQ